MTGHDVEESRLYKRTMSPRIRTGSGSFHYAETLVPLFYVEGGWEGGGEAGVCMCHRVID